MTGKIRNNLQNYSHSTCTTSCFSFKNNRINEYFLQASTAPYLSSMLPFGACYPKLSVHLLHAPTHHFQAIPNSRPSIVAMSPPSQISSGVFSRVSQKVRQHIIFGIERPDDIAQRAHYVLRGGGNGFDMLEQSPPSLYISVFSRDCHAVSVVFLCCE